MRRLEKNPNGSLERSVAGPTLQGPRRVQFRKDVADVGLKQALKNRDEPFGDGIVKLSAL